MKEQKLVSCMKEVFKDGPFWIEHTERVLGNARKIAQGEGMTDHEIMVIAATAILHDIGAAEAMRKYGSAAREYQEAEGPAVARALLTECGYEPEVVERVAFIVGHHHTKSAIDGPDFQVQWEADLLENLLRRAKEMKREELEHVISENFKTGTGRKIAREVFLGED